MGALYTQLSWSPKFDSIWWSLCGCCKGSMFSLVIISNPEPKHPLTFHISNILLQFNFLPLCDFRDKTFISKWSCRPPKKNLKVNHTFKHIHLTWKDAHKSRFKTFYIQTKLHPPIMHDCNKTDTQLQFNYILLCKSSGTPDKHNPVIPT